MKFSIIIAAYNLGGLVCDAIESCIKQTGISRNEYEIITINDGSKDDTQDYINRYKTIVNHTIINKPNGGLSQTRNYGVSIAKGDYIIFLDGDDWLADNTLETLIPHLGKYDIIAYPMQYYYTDKKQIQKLSLTPGIYTNEEFIHKTIGKSQFNIIPAPQKAYRRSFITNNKISFIEGILHEDNPFFIDIMSKCKNVFYINTPLYFYRQNRVDSITSQCTIKNFEGTIIGIQQIYNTNLSRNRDVLFLVSNLHVFQIVGNYSNTEDRNTVYRYYRKLSTKYELLKLLFLANFNIKSLVRHILLIIDPSLLKYIISKI